MIIIEKLNSTFQKSNLNSRNIYTIQNNDTFRKTKVIPRIQNVEKRNTLNWKPEKIDIM